MRFQSRAANRGQIHRHPLLYPPLTSRETSTRNPWAMAKETRKTRKSKRVRIKSPEPTTDHNFYSEDDEDNVCRCICGDNDFTAKRPWIQCTACNVWQHNDCMDVSGFDDELAEHYWCEGCDSYSHAVLLEAVEKGEKPWEDRCKDRLEI